MPEKQHAPEKSVCPGCRRCSYVFMVAWPALLQLVRRSVRLGRPSALLKGAFCAYRSLYWLHVHLLNTMWQFLSPPRNALGFRRRQGGAPSLCDSAWLWVKGGTSSFCKLGMLCSNMASRYLLTALLTRCRLGETVCSYMATVRHGAEFRGRQRSCAQSTFGAVVGPAVGCEVKGWLDRQACIPGL